MKLLGELEASIILAIIDEPQNTKSIASLTKASAKKVVQALHSMRADGVVCSGNDEKWGVASFKKIPRHQFNPSLQITLDRPFASIVQDACEFYARLMMGQFWEVEMLTPICRDLDSKSQSELRDELDNIKKNSLSQSSGHFTSILSDQIYPMGQQAWSVYEVIRHRCAWDRNPGGGFSVQFDEPLGSINKDVLVHSHKGSEHEYLVTCALSDEYAQAVDRALFTYQALLTGNVSWLGDLVRTYAESKKIAVNSVELEKSIQVIEQIFNRCPIKDHHGIVRKAKKLSSSLNAFLKNKNSSCEMKSETFNIKNILNFEEREIDMPPLPTHMKLMRVFDQYWVISKANEGYLDIKSFSHSPQTAVLKAIKTNNAVSQIF